MIKLSVKNWDTLERQPGILKMLSCFDPEEKNFKLNGGPLPKDPILIA